MITKENLKEILRYLSFTEKQNIFIKTIGEAILKVDFEKRANHLSRR